MTIRYNSGDPFGVPSGYAGANVPDGFRLPSCGLEDVDKALFDTFDKEVRFAVANTRTGESTKVPVIFAAGEKWAMLKKGRALRDKTGALVLPLITIRRTLVEQNVADDITGRGINQQTGELVIKRRLAPADRAYQNLINKLGVPNQVNVSDPSTTLQTDRPTRQNEDDLDVQKGGWMAPKFGQNIWEVITIPSPQFFSATYEVTFWAQYTVHMNQLIQKLMSSYLPTGNGNLRLDSPKGYWFVSQTVGNQFTAEDNADDMSDSERILKYKLTIKVPAYLVAPDVPGAPPALRRFVSAPMVSFALDGEDVEEIVNGVPVEKDPYAGADDPSAGFSLDGSVQPREQRTTQLSSNQVRIVRNPFTGREETEYLRITNRSASTGETILKPDDGFTLNIVDR
jgi:hypothetical protein